LTTVTADMLDGSATSRVTTYAYGANGDLVTTDLPNGTVEARTYDADGRLASIATTVGAGGMAISGSAGSRAAGELDSALGGLLASLGF
jgi:YD repeat-containing protein